MYIFKYPVINIGNFSKGSTVTSHCCQHLLRCW